MNFKAKIDNAAMKKVLNKIEELSSPIDQTTAKKLGDRIVSMMKDVVSVGSSPILGRGKFEAYRGEYRRRIQKYGYIHTDEGKVSKRLRPVNLKLTGKFLEALKYTVKKTTNGYATTIGFFESKNQKKEEGHRKGANGQAERPIIPQGGEKFSTVIQNEYLDIINEKIARITKSK